jgi:hypothetical protein
MRFLRAVQTDLRERQIFPAVVVLAVLAVAIPIVASLTLNKVTPPPPMGAAPAPVVTPKGVKSPSQELAALDTTVTTTTTRHGAEPNPFRENAASTSGSTQAASSKVTTKTVTTTTTPTTKTPTKPAVPKATSRPTSRPVSKPGSSSTGATGSSGSAPATGTPVTGPATLKADQAYSVDIDTKDATGVHVLSDVVRLAPLPDAESPEVIFLGALQGGKKAAFLFTNAIAVTSKNTGLTCLPSSSDCQIVELSPGEGLSLYPTADTALIATFSFELVSIGATSYSSDSAATTARNAVSTAGQTLLPLSSSPELDTFSFDSKLGALVHHSAPSGGSSNTGSTGSSGATGATGATGSSGSSGSSGSTAGTDSQAQAVAFAVHPGH